MIDLPVYDWHDMIDWAYAQTMERRELNIDYLGAHYFTAKMLYGHGARQIKH